MKHFMTPNICSAQLSTHETSRNKLQCYALKEMFANGKTVLRSSRDVSFSFLEAVIARRWDAMTHQEGSVKRMEQAC